MPEPIRHPVLDSGLRNLKVIHDRKDEKELFSMCHIAIF